MVTESAENKKPTTPAGITCVLDMGEHSKKRIKRLRRGEGTLMGRVEDAISDLHAQGVLSEQMQTVVVVVRQESEGFSIFGD